MQFCNKVIVKSLIILKNRNEFLVKYDSNVGTNFVARCIKIHLNAFPMLQNTDFQFCYCKKCIMYVKQKTV